MQLWWALLPEPLVETTVLMHWGNCTTRGEAGSWVHLNSLVTPHGSHRDQIETIKRKLVRLIGVCHGYQYRGCASWRLINELNLQHLQLKRDLANIAILYEILRMLSIIYIRVPARASRWLARLITSWNPPPAIVTTSSDSFQTIFYQWEEMLKST